MGAVANWDLMRLIGRIWAKRPNYERLFREQLVTPCGLVSAWSAFHGIESLHVARELMIWPKCSAFWQPCQTCGTELDEKNVPTLKKKELGVVALWQGKCQKAWVYAEK
jgi:hypothetical protein